MKNLADPEVSAPLTLSPTMDTTMS